MNFVFPAFFLICSAFLLFCDPQGFLPALMGGAQRAASLSLSLVAVYAVWLGFLQLLADSGLSRLLSRVLSPVTGKLFLSDEESLTAVNANLAANLLGLGNAATPSGIRAAKLLSEQPNAKRNLTMLFVLNATSLQLLPGTVLSLRSLAGSASPYDILLPTLLSTLFSTLVGVGAVLLFFKKDSRC